MKFWMFEVFRMGVCVYVLVSERFDDMLDVRVVYNIYRYQVGKICSYYISQSHED